MAIHLRTLGGLHVADENGELDWLLGQHSRAALFVYLAVERSISRETLTTIFWPESDAENARHALRQSLYQLRKAIGDEWIESRAHELVVSGAVRSDTQDLTDRLERGDTATAIRIYRGPFLDGVHLVDSNPWESWVDGRRAYYSRVFRKACRETIEAKQSTGDLAAAIEAAEHWAAVEPSDEEAQHRLIETLGASGARAEAIRQFEAYERVMERDGMQPPAETVALVERIRSDAVVLPTLRHTGRPGREGATTVDVPPTSSTPPPPPEGVRHAGHRAGIGRRNGWLLAASAVLVAALAVAWSLREPLARSIGASSNTDPSATTIAVLPFSVRGGASVQYLGDGIVNLLGAALDGAGSLRPVDARATFAAVGETSRSVTSDPRHSAQVASRLGAGMFVLGDVVEAGGRLQIQAAVYRVGAGCARS